jgi:hypothetical protein
VLHEVVGAFDAQAVRIDETGGAEPEVDIVARHLVLDDLDFPVDDVVGAEGEIFHRDVLFDAITGAIQAALMETRQIECGLAERFAGDGAGVGADAADDPFAFDDADFFPQLGSLDGSFLPCRAGSDDQQIVVSHGVLISIRASGSVKCNSPVNEISHS